MRSNGTSVRARVAIRERIKPGSGFLIEGSATAPGRWAGELVEISKAGAGVTPLLASTHLRRGDLDPGRQVDRDLRGDLRDRPDADGARAKAPRALPGPLRAEPRRPLRPAAAARRRRQAGRQGALPARERDPVSCGRSRPRSSSSPESRRWRSCPFGDVKNGVGFYGIDVPIGILYFFAFGSIAFYGLLLGGWASGSKYSFLGAMRAAAQLISYEISMGLALLGAIMMAGSLSLVSIVEAQDQIWYIVPQFVGFLIFMVAGFAETNRAPVRPPRGRRRAGRRLRDRVRRDALRLLRDGRVHRDVRDLGRSP